MENLKVIILDETVKPAVHIRPKTKKAAQSARLSILYKAYSHSIVAGGLELISYTTLLTPFTLFIISLETFIRNSYGR